MSRRYGWYRPAGTVGVCALLLMLLVLPWPLHALDAALIPLPPPRLPRYPQPPVPADGCLWTPGYWQYALVGYYWMPALWTPPPANGLMWTPGYWRALDGGYRWSPGYWVRSVGYYGGINYGGGYVGRGFQGGYWSGGQFYYNRRASNVGAAHITHTYSRAAGVLGIASGLGYNGGDGVRLRPTVAEARYAGDARRPMTPRQAAQAALVAPTNSRGRAQDAGASAAPARAVHAADLPAPRSVVADPSGDMRRDSKQEQQSQRLQAEQNGQRAALQQRQENDHRALRSRRPAPAEQARLEDQHAAQTLSLSASHAAQQNSLRQLQQRPGPAERPASDAGSH